VDQNYTNNQNDFLWTLLANPASDAHQYTYNLQRLVNDFPQSGILQAMLAHASDDKNLRQASAYFNPKSLYKLINSPSSFIGVADEKIIYQGNLITNGHSYLNGSAPVFEDTATTQSHDVAATNNENYFSENPVVETASGNQLHISDQTIEIEPANALHLTEVESKELPPVAPLPEVVTPAENSLHTPYVSLNESIASRLKETTETAPVESPLHTPYVSLNESLASRLKETADSPPIQDAVQETPVDTPPPIPEHVYEPVVTANPVADTSIYEPMVTPDPVTDTSAQEPVAIAAPTAENTVQEEVPDTIISPPPVIEPVEAEIKPAEAAPATVTEPDPFAVRDVWRPAKFIEEETFDEITGIEQINVEPQTPPPAPEPEPIKIQEEKPAPEPVINNEADNTFVDNIAATDYFRFRDKFGEQKQAEQTVSEPAPTPPPVEKVAEKIVTLDDDTDSQRVSKYHDEKMPYSFMWWLDKTRKEHAGIYQPYVKAEPRGSAAKPKNPGDELQQQYYENIFHITSVEELDKTTGARPAPFVVKRKEQGIIERFIKEEPQIRPQSSDKLDNENKAKKSSEDRDEMVTETLAAIYTDQMLYHKAIASYKKLMLKFPEKSRYFASKIEQLEKKTN